MRLRYIVPFLAVFWAQGSHAQDFVPGRGESLRMPEYQCVSEKICRFDWGEETYSVDRKGRLQRQRAGDRVYREKVFSKGDNLRGAALSGSGNILAVAVANVTRSRRSFRRGARPDPRRAARNPRRPRPDDLDRSFRVDLYSPKSGDWIKGFDLGAFSPRRIALSEDGTYLYIVGVDLERREIKEARIYNTRRGRSVFTRGVDSTKEVVLAQNGLAIGHEAFVLEQEAGSAKAVYFSRNSWSNAEYDVTCSANIGDTSPTKLAVETLNDRATGQGEALAEAAVSELKRNGFSVVERARLKDILEELKLAASGLAESDVAIDIGRLGVADGIIFGSFESISGNTNGTLRLVSVETGEISSSCTLLCRDCQDQDLYEGVINTVRHWSR